METYEPYIQDSRYSVPTLVFVMAARESRAKARATEILLQSPCHQSVVAWAGGRVVFTVKTERRQSVASADGSAQGSRA